MVQFLNVLFQEIDELKKCESSCVTSVQFVPRCTEVVDGMNVLTSRGRYGGRR